VLFRLFLELRIRSQMHRWAVLGLLALFCAAAVAEIKLELAGQIHLATSYSDGVSGGTYGYDKGVAEQMTADPEANIIYVVGENSLMQVRTPLSMLSRGSTDLRFCV
jgi:hypothetical protein